MTRAWRVVPLTAALLFAACAGDDSSTTVRAVRQSHAVTTVTTVPVTAPPTTAHVHPRRTAVRASRQAIAPRVAPVPQPAPVASGDGGDCGMWGYKTRARSDECWGPYVASYGDWPTATMLRILYCESKGNPWVVNASNHVGLYQVKNSHTKGDGPGNIAHAHAMWLRSGTAPWRQCGG